jgi:hypothetical protein
MLLLLQLSATLPAAVSARVACCCICALLAVLGQHAFLAQLFACVCGRDTRPTTLLQTRLLRRRLHFQAKLAAAVSSTFLPAAAFVRRLKGKGNMLSWLCFSRSL